MYEIYRLHYNTYLSEKYMEQGLIRRGILVLVVGDLLMIGAVTLFGFATHGSLETAGLRLLTTFLPLLAAWAAAAPALGAYDLNFAIQPRQLWRPFWAAILAAPLAGWLRGAWLNAPILPVFVLVLAGVSALGILAWRSVYLILYRRKR